jgi:hypothetical protein
MTFRLRTNSIIFLSIQKRACKIWEFLFPSWVNHMLTIGLPMLLLRLGWGPSSFVPCLFLPFAVENGFSLFQHLFTI